uniref:Uncharacterized protein n=1 Tax=Lactuca sativa TaxID=4236 RepID=A0A9R1WDX6_LACSA|nr:hypothetical protein LSAT_V11C200082110 [Lactuca sativa]
MLIREKSCDPSPISAPYFLSLTPTTTLSGKFDFLYPVTPPGSIYDCTVSRYSEYTLMEVEVEVQLMVKQWSMHTFYSLPAVAQVVHDKEEASEEDEAEQAYSSLDPYAHRQHYQVQC